MRLSITGANGFLASNIIFYLHYLSSKLNLSIHIEALCRSEKKLFSRFTLITFLPMDLILYHIHITSFNDIAHLEPSQVVIHAASNASPLSYSRDPVSTSLINTQGTIAAIEYAKYSNSKCFVYFSTSGVYGFNNPSISSYKEDQFGFIDSANPENIYIESKRMGECITSSLCSQYKYHILFLDHQLITALVLILLMKDLYPIFSIQPCEIHLLFLPPMDLPVDHTFIYGISWSYS